MIFRQTTINLTMEFCRLHHRAYLNVGTLADPFYDCPVCSMQAKFAKRRIVHAQPQPQPQPQQSVPKGMLIAIEGIDGSGKETHTKLLVDWITENFGKRVITMDFPGYNRSLFGNIIGRYLKGEYGDPVLMDPFETLYLYAGDRMQAKPALLDALKRGHIVLLNRYVPSNMAYGCAKLKLLGRETERDKLVMFNDKLEYRAGGLPRPDLVIVLDIDPVISTQRIADKPARAYLEGEERDKYEVHAEFQKFAREEYRRLTLLNTKKQWFMVSCTTRVNSSNQIRTIEEIQGDLKSIITLVASQRKINVQD